MNKERQLELLDKCKTPLQREELENLFADFDAAGVEYDSIEIDLRAELDEVYESDDKNRSTAESLLAQKKYSFDICIYDMERKEKIQNRSYTTGAIWVFNIDDILPYKIDSNHIASPFCGEMYFVGDQTSLWYHMSLLAEEFYEHLVQKYRYPSFTSDSKCEQLAWSDSCHTKWEDRSMAKYRDFTIGSSSSFLQAVLGSTNFQNARERRIDNYLLSHQDARETYGNIIAGLSSQRDKNNKPLGTSKIVSDARRLLGEVYPDFKTLCWI